MSLDKVKLKTGDKVKCIISDHHYEVNKIYKVIRKVDGPFDGGTYLEKDKVIRLQGLDYSVTGHGARFVFYRRGSVVKSPKNKPED